MTFKRKQSCLVCSGRCALGAGVRHGGIGRRHGAVRGHAECGVDGQPNILFIIDNSGSMGTLVRTQTDVRSGHGLFWLVRSERVYWRTGTGSPPACNTNRYFNTSAFVCEAGSTALASAGSSPT